MEFFRSEPIESVPEDGYYCYKFTDSNGIDLYFSFHEIEGSIQARFMQSDCELVVICEEYAEKITIVKDKIGRHLYLACIFKLSQAESTHTSFDKNTLAYFTSLVC